MSWNPVLILSANYGGAQSSPMRGMRFKMGVNEAAEADCPAPTHFGDTRKEAHPVAHDLLPLTRPVLK
jgi:hypothetical protein